MTKNKVVGNRLAELLVGSKKFFDPPKGYLNPKNRQFDEK